jgi:hypothetical protein
MLLTSVAWMGRSAGKCSDWVHVILVATGKYFAPHVAEAFIMLYGINFLLEFTISILIIVLIAY